MISGYRVLVDRVAVAPMPPDGIGMALWQRIFHPLDLHDPYIENVPNDLSNPAVVFVLIYLC